MRIRVKSKGGKVNLGDSTGSHVNGEEYSSPMTAARANILAGAGFLDIMEFSEDKELTEDLGFGPMVDPTTPPKAIHDCGHCALGYPMEGTERLRCKRNTKTYKPTTVGCQRYWRPKP